ncbi:MAG: HAD family hydrolase, partial [Pseudonocardiaceae bacterium]
VGGRVVGRQLLTTRTPIQGVLFDFYGTLARATAWGDTHAAVFARHGLDYDEAAWTDRWVGGAIDGEDHPEHSGSRELYQAWEHHRLRTRATSVGVPAPALDGLVLDLYQASKNYSLSPYDEAVGVLTELRSRNISVGICSNWDWDLDQAVASVGLSDLVDIAITSAQAGARKPHSRIFEYTLERFGLLPEETLFVGDTWGADVEGPLTAGMPAVHLWRSDRSDVQNLKTLPAGAHRVNDLRGVLDLTAAEPTKG